MCDGLGRQKLRIALHIDVLMAVKNAKFVGSIEVFRLILPGTSTGLEGMERRKKGRG